MQDRIGSLEEGKLGDIIVLKAKNDDPYENFAQANMEDIELLTVAGNPVYGEMRFINFLGGAVPKGYTKITVDKRPMFVKGDPASLYKLIRQRVGFKKVLDFLPFEPET
jgi:hypothetical protein